MKRLIIFYDSLIKDKERDRYLKAIEKNIDNFELKDLAVAGTGEVNINTARMLILKPYDEKRMTTMFEDFFKQYPQLDVEGTFTNKLTITAEAIMRAIDDNYKDDLRYTAFMIINQSNTVGIPLATELMKRGATVMSCNSRSEVFWGLEHFAPEIIISATNNKNFKISLPSLSKVTPKLIIDLSDDVDKEVNRDTKVIKHIDTIEILKERLRD